MFTQFISNSTVQVVLWVILVLVLLAYIFGYKIFKTIFKKKSSNKKSKSNSFKIPDDYSTRILMGEHHFEHYTFVLEKMIEMMKVPYEDVEIMSEDGLKLKGEFYRSNNNSDITIIFVHGYHSTGCMDFGAVVPHYIEKGYNCLFVDLRAHGRSEGKYIGCGILDSEDVIGWINKINEMIPNGKIILYGMSMGASTVLLTNRFDLPGNICGMISDSGYSSVKKELAHLIKVLLHLPAFPLVNTTLFWYKFISKIDAKKIDITTVLKDAEVPILFLHGSGDNFVLIDMAKECYNACSSEKYLEIFDDAPHVGNHFLYFERYINKLDEFIDKYTK